MARASRLTAIAAVACCFLAPRPARAQDTQYWLTAYGTQAQLLGGVVLGSSQDISAAYYNPGALAQLEKTEAVFSGSAYRYSVIANKNGLGEGRNLAATSFSSIPSMFAGEVPLGSLGKDRLAYVAVTRFYFDGRAEARGLTPGAGLTAPDLQFFSGNVWVEESLNDTWAGLAWSHPFNPHLGLGITTFVSVRSQRARFATASQALDSSGNAAVLNGSRDYSYYNWALLWKLGVSVRYPAWSLGLTVTTPSVKLIGSGSAGRDLTFVDEGVTAQPSTVATDFQDGVASTYKNPLAIGAGGSYGSGHTRLHFAVEWFGSVDTYHILATEPFQSQSSGQTLTNEVIQESKSVVNFGVGIEHRFTPHLAGYGAFRTDKSPMPDSVAANPGVSHWDLTHVSGGAAFTISRVDLVVGTDIAWGKGSPRGLLAGLVGVAPEIPPDATISYFNITLMFGLKVAFGGGH